MESKSMRNGACLLNIAHRKVSVSSTVLSVYVAAYRNGYNGADLKSVVSWRTWRVGSNPTAAAQSLVDIT